MAVPDFDAGKGAQAAWNYCKTAKGKNGATGNPYASKHMCVGVLWRTWQACGLDAVLQKHDCNNPSQYMAKLRGAGKGCYEEISTDNLNTPRYGDVALYHGGKTVGHGCIYLPMGAISENTQRGGDRWVSDFVQNGWNVYPGSGARDVCCFRYRGNVVYNGQTYGAQASGAPAGGGGGGGPAAPMKDFNVKEFEIKEDENGQYTEESPLMGIANHIHIGGAGGSGGSGAEGSYNGEIGNEALWGDYPMDKINRLRSNGGLDRAVYVARVLLGNCKTQGFSAIHAAAICGVYAHENSVESGTVCKLEYEGRSKNPNLHRSEGDYGAGIASMTHGSSKKKYIRNGGFDDSIPLEQYSLHKQAIMSAKQYEDCSGPLSHGAIVETKNLVYASACACMLTHGSGHHQKVLAQAGGNKNSDAYVEATKVSMQGGADSNTRNYAGGKKSSYHTNPAGQRFGIAKAILEELAKGNPGKNENVSNIGITNFV